MDTTKSSLEKLMAGADTIQLGAVGAGGTDSINSNTFAYDAMYRPPNNGVYTTYTTDTTGPYMLGAPNITPNTRKITLTGENADIIINGVSLTTTLTALQQRLSMLVPNPELEAEWNELRELGDRYRELEAQCKEKAATWQKLQSINP